MDHVGGSLFYALPAEYVDGAILSSKTPALELYLFQLVLGVVGQSSVCSNRVGGVNPAPQINYSSIMSSITENAKLLLHDNLEFMANDWRVASSMGEVEKQCIEPRGEGWSKVSKFSVVKRLPYRDDKTKISRVRYFRRGNLYHPNPFCVTRFFSIPAPPRRNSVNSNANRTRDRLDTISRFYANFSSRTKGTGRSTIAAESAQ